MHACSCVHLLHETFKMILEFSYTEVLNVPLKVTGLVRSLFGVRICCNPKSVILKSLPSEFSRSIILRFVYGKIRYFEMHSKKKFNSWIWITGISRLLFTGFGLQQIYFLEFDHKPKILRYLNSILKYDHLVWLIDWLFVSNDQTITNCSFPFIQPINWSFLLFFLYLSVVYIILSSFTWVF